APRRAHQRRFPAPGRLCLSWNRAIIAPVAGPGAARDLRPSSWPPAFQGIPMERELFSIEQSARGWAVYSASGSNEPPDPTPLVGVEGAGPRACARYRSTGHRTGVKVRLRCGDTVLVACHG